MEHPSVAVGTMAMVMVTPLGEVSVTLIFVAGFRIRLYFFWVGRATISCSICWYKKSYTNYVMLDDVGCIWTESAIKSEDQRINSRTPLLWWISFPSKQAWGAYFINLFLTRVDHLDFTSWILCCREVGKNCLSYWYTQTSMFHMKLRELRC